jgi:hypothetical protein
LQVNLQDKPGKRFKRAGLCAMQIRIVMDLFTLTSPERVGVVVSIAIGRPDPPSPNLFPGRIIHGISATLTRLQTQQ